MSLIRQNYSTECEAAINKQINLELQASYVYMSMAWYFDRDDVALNGFHEFFRKNSHEEREHAEKLMKFQNQRGGRIKLAQIDAPDRTEWGTGLDAMRAFVELEKNVNSQLLALHKLAENSNDAQMADFIADNFLTEQVEAIKQGSDYVTLLQKVGPGLGEYLFDRQNLH